MLRGLVRSYLMRPRRVLTRFRKDAKGATAIEFGLLAMPFFMMLMMIAMIIVSSPLPPCKLSPKLVPLINWPGALPPLGQ